MISLAHLESILSPEVIAGLADDDGDGEPDPSVIAQAASDAEAEVRQRLAGVLPLPESNWPAHMVGLVATLAVERLYERRREAVPGPWSERARRARIILDEVAAGRRPIEGLPIPTPAIRMTSDPAHRQFTPENLGRL